MFSQDMGYFFTQLAYQVKGNVVLHRQTENLFTVASRLKVLMKLIERLTQITTLVVNMMGKQMLTVPCFTACHYLEGENDHNFGEGGKK